MIIRHDLEGEIPNSKSQIWEGWETRFAESGDISFFNSKVILLSKSHVIWWLLSDIAITLTTFLVIEIAEEVI